MAVSAKRIKSMSSARVKRQQIDFWIFFTVLVMLSIGTVMVFSASAALAYDRFGDTYHFLKKQLLWVIVGLIAMFIMANFDYRKLAPLAVLGLIGSLVLLVLATTPGIGQEQNGARRWLGYGNLSFQPSEMVKITLILFLAYSMSKRSKSLGSFTKGFIPYVLLTGGIAAVLLLQPHLSAALILVSVTTIMMIVAGCKIRHFLMVSIPALPMIFYIAFKMEHVAKRIFSFLDPLLTVQKMDIR